MNRWLFLLPSLLLTAGIEADTSAPPAAPAPPADATAVAPSPDATAAPAPDATSENLPKRPANELDQLVGPIALYPDPLLAIILPASTSPLDIVMAARRLRAGATQDQIQSEPWDNSLKALTHYPAIVKWLDENLEWTSALGEAVAAQQPEVMAAIQRMRAKAKAAGNLPDTTQQQVTVDDGYIEIMPAQDNSVSVPSYNPDMVYSESPADVTGTTMDDGPPEPAGDWLDYDFDWPGSGIWVSDYGPVFRRHHEFNHGFFWRPHSGTGHFGTAFARAGATRAVQGVPHPEFVQRTTSFHRFGSGASGGLTESSVPRTVLEPATRGPVVVEGRRSVEAGRPYLSEHDVVDRRGPEHVLVIPRPGSGPAEREREFVPQRTFVQPERVVNSERYVPPERVAPHVEVSHSSGATSSGGGRGGGGIPYGR